MRLTVAIALQMLQQCLLHQIIVFPWNEMSGFWEDFGFYGGVGEFGFGEISVAGQDDPVFVALDHAGGGGDVWEVGIECEQFTLQREHFLVGMMHCRWEDRFDQPQFLSLIHI